MGKGDRKTAKGKRYNASYGNVRKQAGGKAAVGQGVVAKAAAKAPVKKAVAKKTVVKAD